MVHSKPRGVHLLRRVRSGWSAVRTSPRPKLDHDSSYHGRDALQPGSAQPRNGAARNDGSKLWQLRSRVVEKSIIFT